MLELIFITSNAAKLAHAKHLCRKFAVTISKQKNYGIGYVEPRLENREKLIKASVDDAIERFRKSVPNADNKFFFIEDTSVIISCLSKDKEIPGVDIKYWMKENTFSSVDALLKNHGNDRTVTVRSDLILVLNKELREKLNRPFIIFTSCIEGKITTKEYNVKTQPLYPWLSGETFNKWFVPKGVNKPVSLLKIEQADQVDFRSGAYQEMLKFLEERNHIFTKEDYYHSKGEQLTLFNPLIFIICGPSCAGKSTLAEYLQDKYKYYHIEASDFMYLSYYERHGINSTVKIGDFAEEALRENQGIVSDQIIKNIRKLENFPILITGFRSPAEIESFKRQYKGGLNVVTVYLDADEEVRFIRNLKRGRKDLEIDFNKFKCKDKQQMKMGLSLIRENHDAKIINNDTLEHFYEQFELKYKNHLETLNPNKIPKVPFYFEAKSLQNAIIIALFTQGDSSKCYTTTEIAKLINQIPPYIDNKKNKNNVSRYFNQNYHPYFEIEYNNSTACYRLSQTGLAYAKWLNDHSRNRTS